MIKRNFVLKQMTLLAVVLAMSPRLLTGRSVLVKLANSPALAKPGAVLATTGSAAVDDVLTEFGVDKMAPAFSFAHMHAGNSELAQWVVLEVPESVDPDEFSESLRRSGVMYAHENRTLPLHYRPDDPLYGDQYALQKIGAEAAWELERGSKDVIVAVIDTGIDYEHPDMKNNLWLNSGEDLNGNGDVDTSDFNGIDDDGNGFIDDIRGWDFTDAPNYPDGGDYLERDNDPMDGHGHGTGVAGIIAAETDNEIGIAGLAFGCRVMNLRAFNSSGYGEEDDAASAILYAIDNGAQVINMSFGDVFVSRILDDVLKYGHQQGVLMVASAGNSSTDEIHYPSGFAETISVGASDDNDVLAGFSNFGATIDLVAPGHYVLSLDKDEEFHNWSGTSFSAPYVSAAAALILSNQPGLAHETVRALLVNSADDLGDPGWDDKYGAGRLNMLRALGVQSPVLAHITEPRLDSGFSSGPIQIYGSAWSADFSCYDIYFGSGSNPREWTAVSTGNSQRVIDGLLATWDNIPDQQGEYVIKLSATSGGHTVSDFSTRIFLDRTAPVVENVALLPMLDGDKHSVLLQADVDDLSEGFLYYRVNKNDVEIPLTYRTNKIRYNLSQTEIDGRLDLWLNVINGAGLETVVNNNGGYYPVDLSIPPVDVTRYSPSSISMPFGRLISKTADFNMNGVPELVLSVTEDGAIGPLKLFELENGEMAKVYSTAKTRIPRDVGDSDNDGKTEVLCGFGFTSYIYEAANPGDFPNNITKMWEGDGAKQFWAGRFADLDQDGQGEVIMRVIRPHDNGSTDQFEIFETTGDNQYESVASFSNPTPGENFNGIPRSEVGDFDGDGAMEILLGDSDGDVYIYENVGDNQYQTTWQDDLPLLDSIDFIAAGDFDGDGVDEFIAGCHSDPNLNTEHDYDARHWYYRIYDQFGDNDYRQVNEWRLFGYESVRDFLSSLSAGDIDADGADEIFIAAYPDFYVIDYQNNGYVVQYHHAPVQTSAAVVTDANIDGKNELWIGDGNQLTAFDAVGFDTGPATPVALKAQPLGKSTVQLSWRVISGAQEYVIYRGGEPSHLQPYRRIKENFYLDENVEKNKFIYYAIQAIDPAKTPAESRLSKIVAARPGDRPLLLSAAQESRESIRLLFSTIMNQSIRRASNFMLGDSIHPTSVAHDRSGQHVVLTFREQLSPGEYTITCRNLQDQYSVPLDSTSSTKSFSVTLYHPSPYILDGAMPSKNEIELTFSQSLQKSSAEDANKYSINGEFLVSAAKLINPTTVLLNAKKVRLLAAADDTITLQVHEILSQSGRPTKRGRGDAITLIVPVTDESDEKYVVYPNPFVVNSGAEAITFANLRQGDKVQILTSRGQLVKTLFKTNGNGDLDWNLANEKGDGVASGIYLYRISGHGEEYMDKLAIVR